MIVFIADGSLCLGLLTLSILAQTMPSGAVHPIIPDGPQGPIRDLPEIPALPRLVLLAHMCG